MNRNITKMRAEGKKIIADNERYDLGISEVKEIKRLYDEAVSHSEGIFEIISTAYLVGLASGCRYGTRKEQRKNEN